MKRTWHLARHELRRHRWWALVLAAVMIGMLPMRHLMLDLADTPGVFLTSSALLMVVALGFLVTWASLAPLVTQAELAYGTSSAWMTRPIAGVRLLASKLLAFALLALGVPLVLQSAMMVVAGAPILVGLDAAIGTCCVLGLVSLPLVLLGAVTRTFARFWACLIGSFLAFSVFVAMRPSGIVGGSGVRGAGLFVGLLTASIAAFVLLVWLYQRRRVLPVVLAALACFPLAWTVGASWRWSFSGRPELVPLVATPAKAGVVAASSTAPRRPVTETALRRKQHSLEATLQLAGWPESSAWRLERCSGSVATSAGVELAQSLTLQSESASRDKVGARAGLRSALERLLGNEVSWPGVAEVGNVKASFSGTLSQSLESTEVPEKFLGQARVERIELVQLGRLSMDGTDEIRIGAQRLRVRQAEVHSGRIELRLALDSFSRAFTRPDEREQALRNPLLVVLDRERQVRLASWALGPIASMKMPGAAVQVRSLIVPVAGIQPGTTDAPAGWTVLVIGELPRERCAVPVEIHFSGGR